MTGRIFSLLQNLIEPICTGAGFKKISTTVHGSMNTGCIKNAEPLKLDNLFKKCVIMFGIKQITIGYFHEAFQLVLTYHKLKLPRNIYFSNLHLLLIA